MYQSSKNWFSYWVDWIFKLDILRSYPFGFSHQRVTRKLYNCREEFVWEVFNLILVLKNWCPKTHWRFLFLNHLGFQNHVSPLVEAWFLPSRSQSETIILNRRLGWKYVDFLPCNRNLIRFFVASETWLKQSSKNWFSYWVDWNFKLDILRSYPFRFSHQSVSRKPYSGSAGFDWESFNLVPVSKYWCAKTHWRYLVLNHLDFHNDVSPLVEAWFLPSRSRSKRFIFELTFKLKRCRFSSLQRKPDDPKVPKVSMKFGLSRFSNSIFSEFSGSICCIKISINFFWSCRKSINQKLVDFFVASETWLYQSSKNWFTYWFDSTFKLDILRSYSFGFSHQRVSQKLCNCRQGFDWEVFNLILVSNLWSPRTHWRLCS